MSFRSAFLAVVIAFALILSGFHINRQRPSVETAQPTAGFVRASGKCAECHARLQYSVVHEYEMSGLDQPTSGRTPEGKMPRDPSTLHDASVISSYAAAWRGMVKAKAERPARKVSPRLVAKISTADNSSMPETGSTFHAKETRPS
jgi:hypothetical protein